MTLAYSEGSTAKYSGRSRTLGALLSAHPRFRTRIRTARTFAVSMQIPANTRFRHIVAGVYTPVLAKHLAESTDAIARVPCSGQPSAAPSGVGCENLDVLRQSKQWLSSAPE